VREAARKNPQLRFTALLHHVSEEALLGAFYDLKRNAAVGVDEMTWYEYEQDLEGRIADLHGRIHRGAYRPNPSLRVWIPKADGRQRPLGIASLEDKIVQQAMLWVLNCIYEQDFIGFSYGFRRFRCQHDALDALTTALVTKRVNYVLDADIKGFFDAIDHDRLLEFLSRRIGDHRVLRLIRKWLKAGIMEDGEWSATQVGSAQGSVISPLLSNVYLHYVLDLWVHWWRQHHASGDVVIVRYADDFVMGFENRSDAEACLAAMRDRFSAHGLTLHPEKTRLLEFGRFAAANRRRRGEGKPETFDFLGFTHVCGRTRSGAFIVWRLSMRKRLAASLLKVKQLLRKRLNWRLGEVGRWLRSVAQGWLRYHAVPGNAIRIRRFLHSLGRLWLQTLRRRSQRASRRWTWTRMVRVLRRYLPAPQILHPYPEARFRARLKARAV
jgi:group II intron reverse transcriptase/maturase